MAVGCCCKQIQQLAVMQVGKFSLVTMFTMCLLVAFSCEGLGAGLLSADQGQCRLLAGRAFPKRTPKCFVAPLHGSTYSDSNHSPPLSIFFKLSSSKIKVVAKDPEQSSPGCKAMANLTVHSLSLAQQQGRKAVPGMHSMGSIAAYTLTVQCMAYLATQR